ncbi:glucose-6-phosphate isomerase family protein [Egicoccus sp. AB-alg2]|uniref:glucose-6-phosphate isomerase family protein n=1 Tax=Egicoccus sp. AB-alg2 TaxID=3242693 RepID=UPI00359E5C4E
MIPNQDPFTTWADLRTGALQPERDLAERRLADMKGYYLDGDGMEDRLIYRVSAIPVPATNDEIASSTTVIEPGTVGREYHMTKGHFHATWTRSEIYVGLAGEGLLLLAREDGEHREEPLRPGSINYIPGGWAHRSVNVGDEPLVFLATYIGDAGYDYKTIEEQGFPQIVVRGDDGRPEVVANPRYRTR